MERAEGSGFTLVEELPEIENAMANLKQTEAAYKELLAVLREAFSAQVHVVSKQVRGLLLSPPLKRTVAFSFSHFLLRS